MVVFLDTGVLGFLTNPSNSAEPTGVQTVA
jgi:hypothetical protein